MTQVKTKSSIPDWLQQFLRENGYHLAAANDGDNFKQQFGQGLINGAGDDWGRLLAQFGGDKDQVSKGYAVAPADISTGFINEYFQRHSYANNVQGMQEAGLNEALLYGGSDMAQAPQVQNTTQPQVDPALQLMAGILPSLVQAASVASQARLNESKTQNLDSKTKLQGQQYDYFENVKEYREQLERGNVTIQSYDAMIKQALEQGYQFDNFWKQNTMQYRIDKEEYAALHAEYTAKIAGIQTKYQEQLLQLQIDLGNAQIERNAAEIKKISAEIQKIAEETGLLKLDAKWYERKQFMQYMSISAEMITATSSHLSAYGSLGKNGASVAANWRDEWGVYAGFGNNWGNTTQQWFPNGFYSSEGVTYGNQMQPKAKDVINDDQFHHPTPEQASNANNYKYDWVDATTLKPVDYKQIKRFGGEIYVEYYDGDLPVKHPVLCKFNKEKGAKLQFQTAKERARNAGKR